MAKCEVCGKGRQFGHNVSHAKNRTNRSWSPNVQKMTVTIDGKTKKMKICTRCLRTRNKTSGK